MVGGAVGAFLLWGAIDNWRMSEIARDNATWYWTTAVSVVAGAALTVGTIVYLLLWHLLFMFSDYVFISYAREDERYASKVGRLLRRHGVKVWIDGKLRTGDRWRDELDRRIDGAVGVVLIVTPDSSDSPWVRDEVERAVSQNKPILPLLLRGDPPEHIESTYQYYDARDGRSSSARGKRPSGRFIADVIRVTG